MIAFVVVNDDDFMVAVVVSVAFFDDDDDDGFAVAIVMILVAVSVFRWTFSRVIFSFYWSPGSTLPLCWGHSQFQFEGFLLLEWWFLSLW